MDADALIEALRGTMDPNLREAAERQLNEVKVDISVMVIAVVARSRLGASAVHNIKMGRSRRRGSAAVTLTYQVMNSVTRLE